MIKFASTAAICLIALSAGGCAVEVPMKAFRMGPPDATLKGEAPRQDLKHTNVQYPLSSRPNGSTGATRRARRP
jgi:hypothetical protein